MRKLLRWWRFKRRIESTLPRFNPRTGYPIYWSVEVYARRVFDPMTGAATQIGCAHLHISQKLPSGIIPLDDRCYRFDRHRGMVATGAVWR